MLTGSSKRTSARGVEATASASLPPPAAPFNPRESRYSAIHPEIRRCRIEGQCPRPQSKSQRCLSRDHPAIAVVAPTSRRLFAVDIPFEFVAAGPVPQPRDGTGQQLPSVFWRCVERCHPACPERIWEGRPAPLFQG